MTEPDPHRVAAAPISRAISRRRAVAAAAAGVAALTNAGGFAAAQEATPAADAAILAAAPDGLSQEIVEAFKVLPGTKALKLWAPPDAGRPAWTAELNPDQEIFIGSSFKVYALAEYLRQREAQLDPTSTTPLTAQLNGLLRQELDLDESVFSLDSPVLNAPNLTGKINVLTALEAMISRSDNTATDMVLKAAGADKVQAFVEEIGLRQTHIPASTRQFIGYIFGIADWQNTTWAQLNEDTSSLTPRPVINDEITMTSSPADMVSFFSRALPGEFFRYQETLAVFRMVLMQADAIAFSMPLGVSAFGKGGSIDAEGVHALSFAGGMYVPDRWVYFHLAINWTDAEGPDGGAVQGAYIAAAKTIFALVRDRLSG